MICAIRRAFRSRCRITPRSLTGDIKGLKLGLPREYMIGGLDPEVKAAVDAAVKKFQELGAEIVEISLPHTDYAVATYYIIATAEASANLARFDGIRYGARVDGKRSGGALQQNARRGFRRGSETPHHPGHLRFEQRLLRRLLFARPKSPHAHPQGFSRRRLKRWMRSSRRPRRRRRSRSAKNRTTRCKCILSDIFTISCNLAGICGISVPCGFTESPKLPIGLQLLGKPFGEETILRLAHAYEQSTPWHKEKAIL